MRDGHPSSLLHDVLTSRVYDVARETPLDPAPRLSRRLGHDGPAQARGPAAGLQLQAARRLQPDRAPDGEHERARGVIAASAGNHAQGVAFAARHLGLRAVIVMPQTTPEIKVDAVRAMGAEVVLAGDSYADAKAHCDELGRRDGHDAFIHPFDDPLVIAGQGTIGARDPAPARTGDLRRVFVPVGGGGLIAGHRRLRQGAVAGRQGHRRRARSRPTRCTARSRRAGACVLDHVGIFADGVAVREVGELTFAIARETRGRRRPRHERRDLRRDQGRLRRHAHDHGAGGRARGRGAASALGGARRRDATSALVAILSGANMNFDRLRLRRRARRGGRGARGAPRRHHPRAAGRVPRVLRARSAARVVTEFNYRLAGRQTAHIFVGIATPSREDAAARSRRRSRERGYADARPDGQRAREAARAPHGRRPKRPRSRTSGSAASSSPNGPARS